MRKHIKKDLEVLPKVFFPKKGDKLIPETDASDNCWGCVLKAIPEKIWLEYEHPTQKNHLGIRAKKDRIPKKLQKQELICGYNFKILHYLSKNF